MESTLSPLISPIKIFGGCGGNRQKRIINSITWDKPTYVEPFCGGFNVGLNSPSKTIHGEPIKKWAFDRNPLLITTWRVIRDHPAQLAQLLRNTTYDKENFLFAKKFVEDHKDGLFTWQELNFAHAFLVRNRMSHGADNKNWGWSDRLRRGKPEYISSWETFVDSLEEVSARIANVSFECGDAIQLIKKYGFSRETIFYEDPPFVHESRTSKNNYEYEMSTMDTGDGSLSHEQLIHFLLESPGEHYLSGYRNELYAGLISSRELASWQVKNSAAQTKTKSNRTEVLWKIS